MTNDEGKKYDLIANDFAKIRDSFHTEQKYIDIFINHLKPHAQVIDIGCGSGHPIATYLVQKGLQVTGIDSSKELLKIAQTKCPAMKQIYGDIRSVAIKEKFDGIIEWWCLFHLPKEDHTKILSRFASWLNEGGILEFTTGDREYAGSSREMLEIELPYFSLDPAVYEECLKQNGFEILLKEHDQEGHLVWVAQYRDTLTHSA